MKRHLDDSFHPIPSLQDDEFLIVTSYEALQEAYEEKLEYVSSELMSRGMALRLILEVEQHFIRPSVEVVGPAGARSWVYRGFACQLVILNLTESSESFYTSMQMDISSESSRVAFPDDWQLQPSFFGTDGSLQMRICFTRDRYISRSPHPQLTGLHNLGASCYFNGLLQSLYHLGKFREIIYTGNSGTESPDGPVVKALRRIFHALDSHESHVDAMPLMEAFGWSSDQMGQQQDIQELNRILLDKIESELKPSNRDQHVRDLFEGQIQNYIQCTDVDYKSERVEPFYDLQLNLKTDEGAHLHSFEESLSQYQKPEILENDNAYDAEHFGKQRAEKGVKFLKLPPVLNVQLMRFRFNFETCDMEKLNDRYIFPEKMEIPHPDQPNQNIQYNLQAVVVHSGRVNFGHYYSYVKVPTPAIDKDDAKIDTRSMADRTDETSDAAGVASQVYEWFGCDDENIYKVTDYDVIENNFGGSYPKLPGNLFAQDSSEPYDHRKRFRPRSAKSRSQPSSGFKTYSAYLLVYVRTDMFAEMLSSRKLKDVNPDAWAELEAAKSAGDSEHAVSELPMSRVRRSKRSTQRSMPKIALLDCDDLKALIKKHIYWRHELLAEIVELGVPIDDSLTLRNILMNLPCPIRPAETNIHSSRVSTPGPVLADHTKDHHEFTRPAWFMLTYNSKSNLKFNFQLVEDFDMTLRDALLYANASETTLMLLDARQECQHLSTLTSADVSMSPFTNVLNQPATTSNQPADDVKMYHEEEVQSCMPGIKCVPRELVWGRPTSATSSSSSFVSAASSDNLKHVSEWSTSERRSSIGMVILKHFDDSIIDRVELYFGNVNSTFSSEVDRHANLIFGNNLTRYEEFNADLSSSDISVTELQESSIIMPGAVLTFEPNQKTFKQYVEVREHTVRLVLTRHGYQNPLLEVNYLPTDLQFVSKKPHLIRVDQNTVVDVGECSRPVPDTEKVCLELDDRKSVGTLQKRGYDMLMFKGDPTLADYKEVLSEFDGSIGQFLRENATTDASGSYNMHCVVLPKSQLQRISVRFYDQYMNEVHCEILEIHSHWSTVQDIVDHLKLRFAEPARLVQMSGSDENCVDLTDEDEVRDYRWLNRFSFDQPIRLTECQDGLITTVVDDGAFKETLISSLECFDKSNFIFNGIRLENYHPKSHQQMIYRVCQFDRNYDMMFGHPFLVGVDEQDDDDDVLQVIKQAIRTKYGLTEPFMKTWRLAMNGRYVRIKRAGIPQESNGININ